MGNFAKVRVFFFWGAVNCLFLGQMSEFREQKMARDRAPLTVGVGFDF